MKISIPSLSVGRTHPVSAGAQRKGSKIKLLTIGGSPSTVSRGGSEQTLLQASLLAAGAFAPERLSEAVATIRDDANAFFAASDFDENAVRPVLRFVHKTMSSPGAGTAGDYFAQYAAKHLGLSATLVSAGIGHFQEMEDDEREAVANAVVDYAVSIVPLDRAETIARLAQNRSRVAMLSRPSDLTLSDQVRSNTEQIKDLVAKLEKKPAKSKKSGG